MATDRARGPKPWTAGIRAGCAAGVLSTVACTPASPPAPLAGLNVIVSRVEWRAPPSDPDHVDVEIVVDGAVAKLGSVAATPETCAIRTAAAKTTELLCGDQTFDANLEPGYLVITRDGREVRRLEVGSAIAISIEPYRIPTGPSSTDP
ncbi:MAG: hypothetical protein ABI467_25490 [Kofleriaceae bacterium]